MMQWLTLFRKENLENWRNYKWVWVPLVMILLSIMDPLTTHYMPLILDTVGGVPEGTILEFPTLSPTDALMMSLSQLSSLGVLVVILMSMGSISGEIKSGVTELILVKPVAYRNYITAKWFSLIILIWLALGAGLFMSWYYINLLFGDLSFLMLLQVILFYGLWFMFVTTISILYNTLFRSPGLVAAFSIITIIILSLITNIFSHILSWSPSKLSAHIHESLISNQLSTDLIGSAIITIILSILLLIVSIYILRTKERA